MQTIWQDLRYGARMLVKKPGFALIAVITLALGIGANTAIFSVVNAVLLLPLPYRAPEELVIVSQLDKSKGAKSNIVSYADFQDWRAQSRAFTDLATFRSWGFSLAIGDDLQQVPGATVSANFFELLGVRQVMFGFELVQAIVQRVVRGGQLAVFVVGLDEEVFQVLSHRFRLPSGAGAVCLRPYEADCNTKVTGWNSTSRCEEKIT